MPTIDFEEFVKLFGIIDINETTIELYIKLKYLKIKEFPVELQISEELTKYFGTWEAGSKLLK